PLGIGFYGRTRSRGRVETILAEMLATGALDDPLLTFSALLETGTRGAVLETVNLASLFAAQGAAADAHRAGCTLDGRLENLHLASGGAASAGLESLLPSPDLRSGILLVRPERRAAHSRDPEELRAALRDAGITATTYGGGVVRLSMPAGRFQPGELDHL